ncbi:hypothetical protein [Nesterenkonia suensis]
MTEERHAAAVSTTVKTLGIMGISLLTLTACVGIEEEAGQQDAGQQDVDPDGAEDQGDEPDEIAEDDAADADEVDEVDEADEADDDPGDAPEITDIEDDLWRAMEEAESVVLEVDIPADEAQVEGPEQIDAEEGERFTQHFSGQMDGSGLIMRQEFGGEATEMITFEDATYVRGEDELAAVAEQFPGEIDEDELAEEFEGKWVDYSDVLPEGFTITAEIDDFRRSLEDGGGFGELEGQTETREGEEVWVYTDDLRELVIRAGEEPVLLSVQAESESGRIEMHLSDWNAAEEPERPAEEDILSMEDLEDILG